jgi:hypothetical protein
LSENIGRDAVQNNIIAIIHHHKPQAPFECLADGIAKRGRPSLPFVSLGWDKYDFPDKLGRTS